MILQCIGEGAWLSYEVIAEWWANRICEISELWEAGAQGGTGSKVAGSHQAPECYSSHSSQ